MGEMLWLKRFLRRNGNLDGVVTLTELSELTGIKYMTLYMAVRMGRLEATRSGSIWLSSVGAVERAISAGDLRPK